MNDEGNVQVLLDARLRQADSAFERRLEADYADLAEVSLERAAEAAEQASAFIQTIRSYLQPQN